MELQTDRLLVRDKMVEILERLKIHSRGNVLVPFLKKLFTSQHTHDFSGPT